MNKPLYPKSERLVFLLWTQGVETLVTGSSGLRHSRAKGSQPGCFEHPTPGFGEASSGIIVNFNAIAAFLLGMM